MAKRKATRSAPARARSGRPHPAAPASPRRPGETPEVVGRPTISNECLQQLTVLALRLRVIYGTAVSAELALRRQAALQDPEIADCLRAGVCDSLADHIRDLEEVARRLRSGPPEPDPLL